MTLAGHGAARELITIRSWLVRFPVRRITMDISISAHHPVNSRSSNLRPKLSVLWLPLASLLCCPTALLAQDDPALDCTQSLNPSACLACKGTAFAKALACALQGGPYVEGCNMNYDGMFHECMDGVAPSPPPAPTGTVIDPWCDGMPAPGAFYGTCSLGFVDPVPNLQAAKDPTKLVDDHYILATQGTRVSGIAADGVARIVIQVGGQYAGQQTILSILQEDGITAAPAVEPGQPAPYGWLSSVNGPEMTTTLQISAGQTNSTFMAFAVCHPPLEFSRGHQDSNAKSRQMYIQAVAADGGFTTTNPLIIWRPPVVLVHGLWGEMSDWATFTPFYDLTNNARFFMRTAAYSYPVSVITSDPVYTQGQLVRVRANALGFEFNAPVVLSQIQEYIRQFRSRPGNPTAAAQADVVAHSMGGMVSRSLVGLQAYANKESFGQGSVHKLITIGTPHFGTPIAADLLASPCVRRLLANNGETPLRQASLGCPSRYGGIPVNGAVGDLVGTGDGINQNYSTAVGKIEQIARTVPTAMVAAEVTLLNTSSLDNIGPALGIRLACSGEPLAMRLTSADWPTEFGGHPNDGIVPVSSQLRQSTAGSGGSYWHGFVHSQGTTSLGFTPPFELSPDPNGVYGIQAEIELLLNWSVSETNVFKPIR